MTYPLNFLLFSQSNGHGKGYIPKMYCSIQGGLCLADDENEPGVVRKEVAEEALTTVKARDKYKVALLKEDLPKGDKLKAIAEALSDVHLIIVGSGRVSTTEAKNFNFFVKKEFNAVVGSDLANKETAGILLNAIVWSAFDKYLKFKLEQVEEIRKKKSARIQKILDKHK